MTEQIGDVGKVDAGHSQMGTEAVSKRMNGGRLDDDDNFSTFSRMPPLTLSVGEYPLLAGSIRILLEQKLLHGR